jgi:4'-phosphopantetheinyl transferase
MILAPPEPVPGPGPAPSCEPDPAHAPVKVWLCPNEDLTPPLAGILATHWLDKQERETAARFLFERDRRQYLVAHTLVRRALALESGLTEAELPIWRSQRGRPFLRPQAGGLPRGGTHLDFNLSHAGGYNLLGIVRSHRIGVDVERLDRDADALETITATFAAQEQEWVTGAPAGRPRDRRVLRLWTLKEAYSKALGLGLGLPFDEFVFTLADQRGVMAFRPPAEDRFTRWCFLELEPVPDVLVAVAVPVDERPPPELHLHRGFPWSRSAPQRITLPAPVGGALR